MRKYLHGAILAPSIAFLLTQGAAAQTTRGIFYCPGGQGSIAADTAESTNIVVRNYPLPNNNTTLVIKRVIIYDQAGKVVYNGSPASLAKTVTPGLATGFSTKDVLSPNTGRVSVLVSTTVSGTDFSPIEVLAVNLDLDNRGNVQSRDTVRCSR